MKTLEKKTSSLKQNRQEKVLEIKGLEKRFFHPEESVIFKNIDLTVYNNDSISISGESGEGKSTLLNLLAGLDFPTNGSISLYNKIQQTTPQLLTKQNANKWRMHFGFIFQAYFLFEEMTVFENICMPLKIAKNESKKTHQKAFELMEKLGLYAHKNKLAKFLSGGQKQRCAIARALVNDPLIIFADEPTGNLDEKNSKVIHELLFSLVQQASKTLILTTHNPQLAKMCDRQFVLENQTLLPIQAPRD